MLTPNPHISRTMTTAPSLVHTQLERLWVYQLQVDQRQLSRLQVTHSFYRLFHHFTIHDFRPTIWQPHAFAVLHAVLLQAQLVLAYKDLVCIEPTLSIERLCYKVLGLKCSEFEFEIVIRI